MIKRSTGRRAVLATTAAAVVTAAAGTVAAHSNEIQGVLEFEGGAVIPEGHVEIYLEDPAIQDDARRRTGTTRVTSDGKSRSIAFSLSPPAGSTASPTLEVVALLERVDGWLIARGSARLEAGSPVSVTLNAALY